MASINNITLLGRLTAGLDPRQTQSGKTVASFTLAVDGPGRDAAASFIDCVAWGAAAETIAKYTGKGDQLAVTGHVETRAYTDKNNNKRKSTTVVVRDFMFTSGKAAGTQSDKVATEHNVEDIDQGIDLSAIPF